MNFYRTMIDFGRRKRFASGCFSEQFSEPKLTRCNDCGEEYNTLNYDQLFADKAWNVGMYMDRGYYADFASSQFRTIVSERAKRILAENFSNAVDFGDIKMVSFKDLTKDKLKEIRDWSGYAAVKKIPNDPPQYYRLLLKQGAELDFEKTNKKLVLDCKKCGRKKYEQVTKYEPKWNSWDSPNRDPFYGSTPHIIQSTWTGYDTFYAEGMGNTEFCTEQFVDVYNQSKLTGLEFERVQTV